MVQDLLNQAYVFETQNEWDNAAQCYMKILERGSDDKEILLNLAACLFNKGDYVPALDMYLHSYSHPAQTEQERERILNFVMDTYYKPNEMTLRTNYLNNIGMLKQYQHNYCLDLPAYEQLAYACIPASNDKFYILDKQTKTVSNLIDLSVVSNDFDVFPGESPAVINIFTPIELERILNGTEVQLTTGMKVPVYVIWKEAVSKYTCLQLFDYRSLITRERLVFFDQTALNGILQDFFCNFQTVIPDKVIAIPEERDWFNQVLSGIIQERKTALNGKKSMIFQMYNHYNRDYYRNLLENPDGRLRVLFVTSRFTQVVQYTFRDFMQACCRLGIDCDLLIEESDIHWINLDALVDKIHELSPDIVFVVNNFREKINILPQNLMIVTWVQDVINYTPDASKFGENDYILSNGRYIEKQIIQAGFPEERIMLQPVPVDGEIFFRRDLTDAEKKRYEADVAFCGNYNAIPEQKLQELINGVTPYLAEPEVCNAINTFFNNVYQYLDQHIQGDGLIMSAGQCEEIIDYQMKQISVFVDKQKLRNLIVDIIFRELSYGIHRKYMLNAVIESGAKVKIWGKYWETDPQFAPYAQGWVRHGEDLAKIYTASKMVIGNASHHTAHFRVWESILCGALSLNRFIPSEYDLLDIRDYLSEGEGFVFYDSHQDLKDKIKFYTEHEEERRIIVEKGQEKLRKVLTYSIAAKRWLDSLKASYLYQRGDQK